MRLAAVVFLAAGIAHSQVLEPLLERLRSEKSEVREQALIEIGRLNPTMEASAERLAEILVTSLKDPDYGVRQEAVRSLAKDRPVAIAVPGLVEALSRFGVDPSAGALA